MLPFKEITYTKDIKKNKEFYLAGDIGGTNSNFGIFRIENSKVELIISIHFLSKSINNFNILILDLLNYFKVKYNINLKIACLGVAGVNTNDIVKPTNLDFIIDANEIKKKTKLEEVLIFNDFEILSYGIEKIEKKKLKVINKGIQRKNLTKSIIGAGTGLGKCILIWEKNNYKTIPSEGGHADFPIQNELEFELVKFIQNNEKICRITWETILSGNGIIRIYKFLNYLKNKNKLIKTIKNSNYNPDAIFANFKKDQFSQTTYQLYAGFYGRCAKNFVLETLCLSGLYIAGGIAAKNLKLFEQKNFFDNFFSCSKLAKVIKDIPLTIIGDYNVSLYGAAKLISDKLLSKN